MFRFSLQRTTALAAAIGLAGVLLAAHGQTTDKRGRKYKAPPPTGRIEVTVLRDYNGKPVENAAVVFHPMEGEKDKGSMELKTNEDGKTTIDVLPIGDTVRLQIIAKGFQTYGGDYKVDQPELAIEIKLKRPGEQYSIYKAHAPGADPNAGAATETKSGSGQDKSKDGDASPNGSKDKPEGSSQPQSSTPQPQMN